jgi:hypothetical protein
MKSTSVYACMRKEQNKENAMQGVCAMLMLQEKKNDA